MPKHVSNPKGSLMLGYLKDGSDDEHLGECLLTFFLLLVVNFSRSLFHRFINKGPSLAEGFDIKDGSVSIKCPEVDPGRQYIVVCKSPWIFY